MWPDEPAENGKEIVRIADRTDLALVYLHGFSATKWEVDPVHRRVVQALGANLFLTRLTGHGLDGEALARATPDDWLADLDEALAVGRSLGRRVVLIGTSTGGLLAAMAAARGEDLAGVVLISPNFALNRRVAWVMRLPGIRRWGPHVLGRMRQIEPVGAAHADHWTLTYPTRALWPLVDLMGLPVDVRRAKCPALFLWSDADRVVDPAAIRRAAAQWGEPVARHRMVLTGRDDPMRHILAGDILSPAQTDGAARAITDWLRTL